MTWNRLPACGTAPMTPLIDSTSSTFTPEESISWKRSLVAQCVRLWMLPGPPTALTISCAVDMTISSRLVQRDEGTYFSGGGTDDRPVSKLLATLA